MRIWTRIKEFGPWSRAQRERDLEREIQNHLELEAEESGRYSSHRAFGNATLVKEDVRAAWGWTRLERLAHDVRHALRQVRRNPAFSAIAIATLALGIGVNAAMFSAVDAVLIRPLPYVDAGGLVMIWDDMSPIGFPKHYSTPGEWQEWRRNNTVFTDIAATEPGQAALSDDGDPEQVPSRRVTGNLWTVLGVQPLLGRVFTEDEDMRGVRVAVISYGLWQRRFGASRDVVGRQITLNDNPYEVIGVMPREFYFMPGRDIDIWMPIAFSPEDLTKFSWHDVHCVARLKPGVTLEQARESMAALSLRVSAPHVDRPRAAVLTPLREELAGKTQTSLIVLLGASAAVLLIACVNLANLLMSRGAVRRRELAVRAALGAGRSRLITQFLMESIVLAVLGAIAGLALAIPAMRFMETVVPETMAAVRLTLDWRVLSFSAVIAIAAALTFGLGPALTGSHRALQERLRDGGRGSSGTRSHWFQHSLIVMETALAVVLLTSGGLLLQTFQHLRQLDLGIRRERLLTFETPLFRYRDFDRRVAFINAELEKIRSIPGVVSAGAISRIPLTANDQTTQYALAGQPISQARGQDALSRVVTRDYFATIGARLREGRFFETSDQRSESPVVVVNESFADHHFPGRSPLGSRIKFGRLGPKGYSYTIVGVVREIRDRGVAEELKPAIYRVHEQADQSGDQPSGILVRTSVEPASIVSAVREAIGSVDKSQPITRIQTVEDIVARQLSAPSQNTTLLSAFALLALLLASLGLYGVLSYAVTQRTNEIGVRMALGATSRGILLSFQRRGLALTVAGIAIGVILSAIAARLMTALLYGFEPDYIPTVAVASLILLVVAAVASFVPARRASRIDPMIALQHE
ncbi:MAG TPA: ABC transporter permease [Terriglobia bacterium]|nr:ABC transporter permease [Terriglobia bacterium]